MDKAGQNVPVFEEIPFLQATYDIKTENTLSLCQFDAGGWRKEKSVTSESAEWLTRKTQTSSPALTKGRTLATGFTAR